MAIYFITNKNKSTGVCLCTKDPGDPKRPDPDPDQQHCFS